MKQFWTVHNHPPWPIALMFVAACLASNRLCLFTLIPLASQSEIKHGQTTTGTATEINPQRDSNPILTSTSQQACDLIATKLTWLPLLVHVCGAGQLHDITKTLVHYFQPLHKNSTNISWHIASLSSHSCTLCFVSAPVCPIDRITIFVNPTSEEK